MLDGPSLPTSFEDFPGEAELVATCEFCTAWEAVGKLNLDLRWVGCMFVVADKPRPTSGFKPASLLVDILRPTLGLVWCPWAWPGMANAPNARSGWGAVALPPRARGGGHLDDEGLEAPLEMLADGDTSALEEDIEEGHAQSQGDDDEWPDDLSDNDIFGDPVAEPQGPDALRDDPCGGLGFDEGDGGELEELLSDMIEGLAEAEPSGDPGDNACEEAAAAASADAGPIVAMAPAEGQVGDAAQGLPVILAEDNLSAAVSDQFGCGTLTFYKSSREFVAVCRGGAPELIRL